MRHYSCVPRVRTLDGGENASVASMLRIRVGKDELGGFAFLAPHWEPYSNLFFRQHFASAIVRALFEQSVNGSTFSLPSKAGCNLLKNDFI